MKPRATLLLASCILFGVFISGCQVRMPEIQDASQLRLNRKNIERKLQLSFQLHVHNPNSFKIKVKSYRFDIHVNGIPVGQINSQETLLLKKKATSELPISLKIGLKQLGLGAATLLTGKKEVKVHLKGKLHAKAWGISKRISVNETKTISIHL